MGKKESNFSVNSIHAKVKQLGEQRINIDRFEREVRRECMHQTEKKGEVQLQIKQIDSANQVYECTLCGESFSLLQHSHKDIKQSVVIINDVIQQMRLFSDITLEADRKLGKQYGNVAVLAQQLPRMYQRHQDAHTSRKKKKKKNNKGKGRSFGSYSNAIDRRNGGY